MQNINEVKNAMVLAGSNWKTPFYDFVDDFRKGKYNDTINEPLVLTDNKFDALLASTIIYLLAERNQDAPEWTLQVPALSEPWFISGIENLKAMSIRETPACFKQKLIFVLDNFLYRV